MLLRITPEHALYVAAALTLMAALPGGMRSLTWTQAIQYFVIALACLVPSGFLALSGPTAEDPIAQDFGALLLIICRIRRIAVLHPLCRCCSPHSGRRRCRIFSCER